MNSVDRAIYHVFGLTVRVSGGMGGGEMNGGPAMEGGGVWIGVNIDHT